MAPDGLSKNEIFSAIVKAGDDLRFASASREKSTIQKEYNNILVTMTDALKHGALKQDAEFSIKIERACVQFKKAQYGSTPEEIKRYDKQLSELASADNSLELVSNPAKYKAHIEKSGVSFSADHLPQGEACLSHTRKQIQYLAQAKKGMTSELEKEFMLSRQANLRAGIAAFKELQRAALFPSLGSNCHSSA